MEANQHAPVYAKGDVEIAAKIETVWDVMSAIDRWPEWNPDVKEASLSGELGEGSQFRWKTGPGTITSTLQRVEPPHVLGWTGKTLTIKATHVWHLEGHAGNTMVTTYESWEGLIARLFRGASQKTVERAIQTGLRYLKAEAERRSS
jgi:uncharacterized protein YndB with AHSA1/START domain